MKRRHVIFWLAAGLTACSPAEPAAVPQEHAVAAQAAALSPSPEPTPAPTPIPAPRLLLTSVFGPNRPDLKQFDPAQIRVMVATGDVIPARGVNERMVKRGDFLYPWRKTTDLLKSGDLLFINLEAPLMAGCPVMITGFTFCGDARAIAGFDYAGVNVANLANNHLTNFGPKGTSETIALLAKHNIGVCGLGLSEIRDVRGLKFGFIGFNGVGVPIDRAELKREIDLIRPKVDVLVVAFHWGKEYELMPQTGGSIAPDNPREVGHLAIDLGADLVIGNHPHWVQPVEIYKEKLIAYAHGNFIFDQMWSQETREGVVGRYTFYGNKLISVDYHPVLIEDYAQPHFLDETQGEGLAILERMRKGSEELTGEIELVPATHGS